MDPKIRTILLGSLPFVAVILVWLAAIFFNFFPKWLLPDPLSVLLAFLSLLFDGTLLRLVYLSAINSIPSFLLALFSGVVLGSIIGASSTAKKIFFPFLSAIYPIPSLAWLPFIILFLGFTRETIWAVIFISSFMKIIYNVISGIENVDYQLVLAAKNLGFKRVEIIYKVLIPSAFPQIMTGVRLGFGSAWRSLIGAEMLVITLGGLGKFIWSAQWFFDFEQVFAGLLMIAIIGILFEQIVFRKIEKETIAKWGIDRN